MNGAAKVICVGTSAGGITALQHLLGNLAKSCRLALVVVQHLPKDAEIDFELVFRRFYRGHIGVACDKTLIEPASLYFAPPGYHLLIERDMSMSLCQDEPVHFARPSIDVLFQSAAWALREKSCGVLLTGANADGAEGLKQIHDSGGLTIVQDPGEAEVSFMPSAALRLFQPDCVRDLAGIAEKLNELAKDPLQ